MFHSIAVMTLASLALFTSTRSARAFAPRTTSTIRSAAATTARHMSSGPMPFDDARMPFYALGVNLAIQVGGQANIKTLLEDNELDIVLQAFSETLKGTNPVEPRAVLGTYGPELNKILSERSDKIMDRIKKEGDDFIKNFLDCNEEAKQFSSGLVYCPMKEGTGKSPTLQSTVEVHYHGTLIDGTIFDSSVERGQTISFPLGGVIPGWQEGLQLMKEGGKATLICPSNIAYGDAGSGDVIPPGATLKFVRLRLTANCLFLHRSIDLDSRLFHLLRCSFLVNLRRWNSSRSIKLFHIAHCYRGSARQNMRQNECSSR